MNRAAISVATAWGALGLLGGASLAGVRFNATASMPAGVWLQRPYVGAVAAGQAVAVCLPPTGQTRRYIGPGPCPTGLEPLLKTVGAVAGDTVTLRPDVVAVNGRVLPGSAALAADAVGRQLTAYPAGAYQVRPGQVFLFSSHDPRSYDSRYLGPIDTGSIIGLAVPLLTFN